MVSDFDGCISYATKTLEYQPSNYKAFYLIGISQIMKSQKLEEDFEALLKEGLQNIRTGWPL